MKVSGIYRIKNIITGDIYIGSSYNVYKRFVSHKRDLKINKHHSSKLQRSYNKYGINNFIFDIICFCDISLLLKLEQLYINSMMPHFNCTKSTLTPMLGKKHSEQTIEKFKNRKTKKGADHHLYGTKWSDSLRKKLLSMRVGQKRSQQFKDSQRERALKNNYKDRLLESHILNKKTYTRLSGKHI